MATYSKYSPYRNTPQTWYLGYYDPTPIVPADDDIIFTVTAKYALNPTALSKEMYGNERLYYIFTLANLDIISDPIYDFVEGLEIRVPSNDRVQKIIGGNF